MRRLHVVGCHRSGTTLLHTLVATGFDVDGAGTDEIGVYQEPTGSGLRPFASRKPRDVRVLAPLFAADPDLHALYLVRDPRAVIASVHASRPDRYFTHLGAWLECERHALALEEHPRFLTVRYEDLVQDPDRVQDAIARAFPFLVRRGTFSGFAERAAPSAHARIALGGLRPVEAGRVALWRAHLPRVKAQMLRYRDVDGGLVAALVRRGYEPDGAWTAALAEVEPADARSRTPEREGFWRRFDRRLRDRRRRRRRLAALAARSVG